jgi:hypothetical protein
MKTAIQSLQTALIFLIEGYRAVITSAGTRILSGTLDNGQIRVDTPDNRTVRIIFNNATISNTSSAPIYFSFAGEKQLLIKK